MHTAQLLHASRCELEVVFLARGTPMLPELWRFHQLSHNGCAAGYRSITHAPNNSVVMVAAVGPNSWQTKDAEGRVEDATVQMVDSAARFRDGLYACTVFKN